MTDSTTTELESQLRTLGSYADAGDPESEWRPGDHANAVSTETADTFRDAKGYSSADYETAAAELEADGKPDLAARARQNAAAVQQADAAARQHAFAREWQQHVDHEHASSPELNDEASDLSRAVQEILREVPALTQSPRGFQHAAAVARARAQAVALPALQARVAALAKENERLARLTSIPGSPPARTGRDEEPALSERDLRRLAHDFDSETSL